MSQAGVGAIPSASELLAQFGDRIRLYGLRHLRDPDAAEDLVQEVVLTTLDKLRQGEIRELERLPSFVLGTCRMRVRNEHRGEQRRGALLQTHADAAAPSAPADVVHPLDARRLAQCLAALPERARTLLLLTFYAGQSAPEVARELQMSPENVRVLRHRTIGRMRACMEGSSAA